MYMSFGNVFVKLQKIQEKCYSFVINQFSIYLKQEGGCYTCTSRISHDRQRYMYYFPQFLILVHMEEKWLAQC